MGSQSAPGGPQACFAVPAERKPLLEAPEYRAWFKRQWKSRLLPKVFHRDFREIAGWLHGGAPMAELGRERGFGRVLRAGN